MGINEFIKIGLRIKEARISKGISQKDMAAKLGINRSTYSNYENDIREPNLEVIEKIANTLNIPLSYLFSPSTDSNEIDRMSDEIDDFINKMVDADVFHKDIENYIVEERVFAELYHKYFVKLFSWRFKSVSTREYLKTMISWLIGLKFSQEMELNDDDIEELSVLFERFLLMKSHEHDFFTYYQEKYGAKDYSLLSDSFITNRKKKEGE